MLPTPLLTPLITLVAVPFLMATTPETAVAVPGPPTSFTATTNGTDVDLTWDAPVVGAPLTAYAVKRQGTTPVVRVAGDVTATTWTTGWAPTDTFAIRAINTAGRSTWATTTIDGGVPDTGGPYLPYKPGSYFTSVPGPIDVAATAAMRTFLATHPDQKGITYPKLNGVGGNQWGMVYREGSATDPIWKLTGNVPAEVSFLSTVGFHAPANLADSFTGTSDSPMVVLDRGTGETIWASKVSKGTGNTVKVAGAAGAFRHDTNGLDRRRPESDSGVNFRSRGAIPDSMVIRKDRLDWAVAHGTDLGYVLHLFWVETDSSAGVRFPMAGAESGQSGWGAEGQRVSLDPAIDLSTRNCSPYALAIARTLQTHGAYLGDNSGQSTVLKLEQDQPGHVVWGNSITQDELASCITWKDWVANVTPR